MARKKLTCFVSRCDEPPYLGGRCKEHYDEDKRKQQERRDAVEVLNNSGVDGTYPTDKSLRQLLSDIQKWWSRAHSAMAYGRTDSVLRDEAEYAAEWCVALANFFLRLRSSTNAVASLPERQGPPETAYREPRSLMTLSSTSMTMT